MATSHTHCFVGNIGFDVSEKEITEMLERCGRVRNFRVVTDPSSGKPKGYGFVGMCLCLRTPPLYVPSQCRSGRAGKLSPRHVFHVSFLR